jgi:hypothetical protein
MQSFPDMAEAHAWTLQRLREMGGRLTEQAYHRASEAAASPCGERDDEAQARWMLVFDRMARGLRLSIALEARLARERRWDAQEIAGRARRDADGETGARPDTRSDPCDADRERDGERDWDGLPKDAPLGRRIARLKAIVEAAGHDIPPRRVRFVTGLDRPPDDTPWDLPPSAGPAHGGEGAPGPNAPWRGSG